MNGTSEVSQTLCNAQVGRGGPIPDNSFISAIMEFSLKWVTIFQ
jgi:hypothetical protein